MIAVITKYYPLHARFEEVLNLATALSKDNKGLRKGCYETRLYASPEHGEIKSVSLWENREIFEAYLDHVISGDELLEFQSTYMRREIDTRIYETIDTGVIGQFPIETELERRQISC
ncbi:hypothetical protein [Tritonibacter scottomollicae]|uniref:ABM domain-containing protein n=1 Tax=Tritonibacter scottomollicae TaxID=483013 RepID=A0A2T1A8W7_TRISK|nr:hypothetical protein [Tritonibacter scottomollicae]PRZ45021.1 hypothetical protein CLV89_11826 [Tritonibacter scottomollicae]